MLHHDSINNNNNATHLDPQQQQQQLHNHQHSLQKQLSSTSDFSPHTPFDVTDFEVKVAVTVTSSDSLSGFTQTTSPLESPPALVSVSRDSPEFNAQFLTNQSSPFNANQHVTSLGDSDVIKKSLCNTSSGFEASNDLNANFVAPSAPAAYRNVAQKSHPHYASYQDGSTHARAYAQPQSNVYADPTSGYSGYSASRALPHRYHPYGSQLPYSYATSGYPPPASASYYQGCGSFPIEQYPHIRNPQIPPQNFLDIPDISQRNSLYSQQLQFPFVCSPRYVSQHHYLSEQQHMMSSPIADVTSASALMAFEEGGMGVGGSVLTPSDGVMTEAALLSAQNVSEFL